MSSMVKSTPALMRGGQQVQHGVGRAAHGDVERHGVFEGGLVAMLRGRTRRRPARSSAGEVDDQVAGFEEQALAVGVGGSVEPLPGSDRPSASVRQFIELAVNMPEQEPQVGQASARSRPRPRP
jgi:hypothetical protein